jgi:D-tagatose-1,6-bisphosphate aldolase subunit GatZ/KbaZ
MAPACRKNWGFTSLIPERQAWLVQTGARYIWTTPSVMKSRERLYTNLKPILPDAHAFVVERISQVIDKYISAFNLENLLSQLE